MYDGFRRVRLIFARLCKLQAFDIIIPIRDLYNMFTAGRWRIRDRISREIKFFFNNPEKPIMYDR